MAKPAGSAELRISCCSAVQQLLCASYSPTTSEDMNFPWFILRHLLFFCRYLLCPSSSGPSLPADEGLGAEERVVGGWLEGGLCLLCPSHKGERHRQGGHQKITPSIASFVLSPGKRSGSEKGMQAGEKAQSLRLNRGWGSHISP